MPGRVRLDRRERAETVQTFARQRTPLRKEIEALEREIAAIESEQADLVETLNTGDVRDYAALNRRLSELRDTLAARADRWAVASLELETLDRDMQEALG